MGFVFSLAEDKWDQASGRDASIQIHEIWWGRCTRPSRTQPGPKLVSPLQEQSMMKKGRWQPMGQARAALGWEIIEI